MRSSSDDGWGMSYIGIAPMLCGVPMIFLADRCRDQRSLVLKSSQFSRPSEFCFDMILSEARPFCPQPRLSLFHSIFSKDYDLALRGPS